MGIRRDAATLTAAQKRRFVRAVLALKRNGMYDMHVDQHRRSLQELRPSPAHRGPAFFPWHRECLRRFERALKRVDARVDLPYWDWTRDRRASSPIFQADFLGGNGRASDLRVMDGPFAYSTGNWRLTVNDNSSAPPYLRRSFGTLVASLPTARRTSSALNWLPYDAAPWNAKTTTGLRGGVERIIHNRVHNWVGGTMTQASSPNDPLFWLLHCNLDRLWARWQRRNPDAADYVPKRGGPTGHNLNDPMWPWSKEANPPTPRWVLDHTNLGYEYDDEASWR